MKPDYVKVGVIGFGFLGTSVIWSIYNAFVPVFLSQKFHLSPVVIAFFITLDNIAGLLIQPPVGVWSDKLRTPIGRRMPFILVGAPLAALAFAAIPVAPVLPLFVAGTSTLLISMAIWRTPVVALVADVTPSPFRSQASGVLNFMAGIGAILAYFGGAALFTRQAAFPFWMGAIIVLVATFLMVVFVREPKAYQTNEVTVSAAQPGFIESLKLIFQEKNKSALYLLLATFCLMVSYTAVEGFFTLYALHHVGLTVADGTRLLGLMSLAFVVFAMPSGYLGARVGRRLTIITGLLLMGSLMLALYFLPVTTLRNPVLTVPVLGAVPVIGVLLMFTGMAWAFIIIHPLPMLSDMTSLDRIGTYTGLYYLFTSLAAVVGPNINGWIVQWSGQNYNAVMLFAPAALAVAIGLMLRVEKGESWQQTNSSSLQDT